MPVLESAYTIANAMWTVCGIGVLGYIAYDYLKRRK